jgi:hypothetical protein
MISIDFLSLINSVGENDEKYIFIVVCYFIKIVFLKAYKFADIYIVIDFWTNHLVLIFDYLNYIYIDNSTYFIAYEVQTLFNSHRTDVIYTPISHPQSVGLIERYIQLTVS